MKASMFFYEGNRVALRGGGPKGTVLRVEDPRTVIVKWDGSPKDYTHDMGDIRKLPPQEAGKSG